MSFCPIDDNFEAQFDRSPFQNTAAIEWMHGVPPRFGNPSDLNALFDGSNQEGKDYVKGLLAASIVMFCFFLGWIVTLLVFKCLGPRHVGIWSGSFRKVQPEPKEPERPLSLQEECHATEDRSFVEYERQHAIWTNAQTTHTRNMNIMRVIVLFAGTSIIISAGLLMDKGVASLVDTLDGGRNALDQTRDLTRQGIALIDKFLDTKKQAETDTERLLIVTNTFCPAIRPTLCADILNGRECTFEGIPFASVIEEVISYFEGTNGLVFEEITNFRSDLELMLEAADDVEQKAATFNWAFWCAFAFSLILAVLSFVMMIGVILAWYRRTPTVFYYARSFIMVPLFVLMVLCSWIFAMVFVIGSMALADTCVDSPDGIILKVLDNVRDDISSIIADFLIYYISGCPADSPPVDLLGQLNYARDSIPQFISLVDTLRANTAILEENCGSSSSPDLILDSADVVANVLCRVADILREVRVFFNCENFSLLYEGITYETVCYSGTDGFAWVSATQFVIVFMTMVILTLRITFYEGEVIAEEKQEDNTSAPHSPKSVAIAPQPVREAHIVQPDYSDDGGYPQIEMVDSDPGVESPRVEGR